jgi:DNA-binding transcriptional LysR family regulator
MVFTEVRRQQFEGCLRIGATEDFAEDRLPELLREFALANPEVRIDLVIDVNRKLHAGLARGDIDVALVVQDPFAPREGTFLFREDLIWIASDQLKIAPDRPIPLIVFDEPCIVRDLAVRALEEANREYRIVCTSPSLSGLRMAVRAGLGVTVRTRAQIESGVREIALSQQLPKLPEVDLCIFTRDEVFSGNSLLVHMKSVLMDTFKDSRFSRRLTAVRTKA